MEKETQSLTNRTTTSFDWDNYSSIIVKCCSTNPNYLQQKRMNWFYREKSSSGHRLWNILPPTQVAMKKLSNIFNNQWILYYIKIKQPKILCYIFMQHISHKSRVHSWKPLKITFYQLSRFQQRKYQEILDHHCCYRKGSLKPRKRYPKSESKGQQCK